MTGAQNNRLSELFGNLRFIFRESAKQIFECFCEVASSTENQQPWILQKYPESYEDVEVLKSVPKFTYPCELEK